MLKRRLHILSFVCYTVKKQEFCRKVGKYMIFRHGKRISMLLIVCAVAVWLTGCGALPADVSDPSAAPYDSAVTTTTTTTGATTTTTTVPPVPVKVSSATILSIGDIMVHEPQLTGARVPDTQTWDFTAFFKEIRPYFAAADFSVANLETTFAGNQNRSYGGYPTFNTPDSLIDAIKASGLSMVLTANNHCYDTGATGFERTQQVLGEKGMLYNGTRPTEDVPCYTLQEINGIRVGMVSYTYETGRRDGLKTVNGITVKSQHTNLLNSFTYQQLDAFYAEVDAVMAAMKAAGAEATVFYMHWGNEYKTTENSYQNKIAQALCDRGVDVIVGGHPHVIQPIEMLTSKDGSHRTVCAYSLGNAVSDQRQERMDSCPSGHTEDGLLFYCTFDKYSDGSVVLADVDAIPSWVDKYPGGSGYHYTICPLESRGDGASKYGFTGTALTKSQASYDRTWAIIAEGLTACRQALGCAVTLDE